MAMQVVTSENFQTLIEKGSVPEFKAPDAKAEAAPASEQKAAAPATDDKTIETERDPITGQFVKKEVKEDSPATTDKVEAKAEKSAVDEDDDDKDLPERVRRQIGKKHRAMKEAEETARQWWADKTAAEERAEKAERELAALKNPQKSNVKGEPKAEDYKTNAEYIDAMVEWRFEQKEAQEQQKRVEAAQAKAQAEFIDRLNAVRKEIPDFDEVTGEADIDVAPHVASYIAESELGPKLGYYFAKNPDELSRIQKLSPIRGIAELGKLEASLDKKPEPKEVKAEPVVSKAPAPITPIDASKKAVVQKDPANMTFQELREYERQKTAAKRG